MRPLDLHDRPLLRVRDLCIIVGTRSGPFTLVDGVSFDVAKGEVLGIAGESGSGKSISMLALLGLLPSNFVVSGSALLGDVELLPRPRTGWGTIRGREVGIVFQDPKSSLHPMLSIGRQLTEHVRRHLGLSASAADAHVLELLERVRIPDARGALTSYPHQFSGGMRQRISIAMALACKPRLLIADEPTTDLDVTVQASILRVLDDIRRDGSMSIIFITHDLGVMAALASRLIVLYSGRVVEAGTPEGILLEPRHPYTRALLNSVPKLHAGPRRALEPIPGNPPPRGTRPPGCAFNPRCPFATSRCPVDTPPLLAVSDQRDVACWVDPFGDTYANH